MSRPASTDTPIMQARPAALTIPRTSSFVIALLIAFVFVSDGSAQIKLPDWLRKVPVAGISEAEAGQGIKEALAQGVTRAVFNLHRTDGFFGSNFYKMLLPPDSRKAEGTLRRIGLGGQVDKAILAINRGAEDAVGTASPIFTQAIKDMTVTDALGIVRGNKDGATQYFRQKTSADLIAAFAPSVRASLEKTHATKYYGDIANNYNRFPLGSGKIDPDLTSYVVGKAVDALFDQIAREEANIRANPVARTTDILKKVFGGG
ncbi:MAG TPA: DUF4197 domain-containing protein [Vicinamibacterales bacterium]|nr:DUF4197 domain-containing protein [Vicinamibacterales bacterium]